MRGERSVRTLFATSRGFVYVFNLSGVAIIIDHPVKFERYQAFDNIFLFEPFEFAEHGGHERGDLIFVYFHFFKLVDEVEELLFADGVARGQRTFFELLVDDFFNLPYSAFLADMADRNRDTRFPARAVRPLRCVYDSTSSGKP